MKFPNLVVGVILTLFLSSNVLAVNQDHDFDKERDREISRGKERIQITEDRIKCLQNSKDFEGLKVCNNTADKKADALEARIKSQAHDKKTVHDNKRQDGKHLDKNKHP